MDMLFARLRPRVTVREAQAEINTMVEFLKRSGMR
jgi:hypothetical protein